MGNKQRKQKENMHIHICYHSPVSNHPLVYEFHANEQISFSAFICTIVFVICLIFVVVVSLLYVQQYSAEQQFIQTTDNLVATRTSLKLQLQSSHFHGSQPSQNTGGLTLKCIAEIPNLYYLESSELELGVPQRDPIPARGKCTCHLLNLTIHCISIHSHVYTGAVVGCYCSCSCSCSSKIQNQKQ